MNQGISLSKSALKAGMSTKTARKYLELNQPPSELREQRERHWRTRSDPFQEVWHRVEAELAKDSGLKASTLFEWLQSEYPGEFEPGQERTFRRRVKEYREANPTPQEVYFDQAHPPGMHSQSDYKNMNRYGVTIQGQPFDHLLYHFVLPYSGWESAMVCFSESFESLSEGLQKAFWELGKVPLEHQTDSLSAAVINTGVGKKSFTASYEGLLNYYDVKGNPTNKKCPHENGAVEQRHYRLADRIDQQLRLRGSRDFGSKAEYEVFVRENVTELNKKRSPKLTEELKAMRDLPSKRLESFTLVYPVVTKGSLIRVKGNVYSVPSDFIGQKPEIRLYANHLELWQKGKCVEQIQRLIGKGQAKINYRHLVHSLICKPKAFENYKYREQMYPTHRFRVAFDQLTKTSKLAGTKEYLQILYLAAMESESHVDQALKTLIEQEYPISSKAVSTFIQTSASETDLPVVSILEVNLNQYDDLLQSQEESHVCT